MHDIQDCIGQKRGVIVDSKIKIFEDKKICTIWNEETEQWYFSVVDVCEVPTTTGRPKKYWAI